MKILIAPDSFKGCLSAAEAAQALSTGVKRVFKDAVCLLAPIADGGEGTVDALVLASSGKFMHTLVCDPLGREVNAKWGILGNSRTAVIEMAAASGLPLLLENGKDERNPLLASTYGTGQLVKAALDCGIHKIIMGIGGSATNDGGSGLASALGVRFLDKNGQELPQGGGNLAELDYIDSSNLDPRLQDLELLVACDVDNPLCGAKGAAAVYGPQKGANPEMVAHLDKSLALYAQKCTAHTSKNVADLAGAGAAGGLGAGLMFFSQAKLISGAELVLDTINLPALMQEVSFVITGEGATNFQTVYGKAPIAVAKLAKAVAKKAKRPIPVICISGALGENFEAVYEHGIDALMAAIAEPMNLEACLLGAKDSLASAAERACRLLKAGMALQSI